MVVIAILSFFTALIFAADSSVAPPDSWRQFRGNPQLTGVSSSVLPDHLRLLWTYQAAGGIDSSVAIADGTVFVGCLSGELLALDLATGRLRWSYQTESQIGESSPAVIEDIVYVGDLAGAVHAVNASTGKGIWIFKTGAEIKSSPVVVEGKVLIGSYNNSLYCISARTGKLVWKVETEGPVHCTVGVNQNVAYISGCDERFRAVRIESGREIFSLSSGSYTAASPALLDGRAFYGTFESEVIAVELAGRRILWRYRNPQREFPYYSSAAIAQGKVLVGGRDKLVHCLDAETGKEIWSFPGQARIESSPAVAGGRVVVGCNDGRLYVLDLKSGAKVWEFNAGAPLSASPAIASGRVVIGSQDGTVYCFG